MKICSQCADIHGLLLKMLKEESQLEYFLHKLFPFLLSGFTPGCSGSPHFSENERTWSQLDVGTCTAAYKAGWKKFVHLDGSQECRSFLTQPRHGIKKYYRKLLYSCDFGSALLNTSFF